MKDKTILGSWCTEPYCKFIDNKHIQIELVAHIWYSYNNDSKTDVINKKLCFVTEIDFDKLNNLVEILEEEKKIPKKYVNTYVLCDSDFETKGQYSLKATEIIDKAFEEYSHKINEIIDYLNSKGE